MRRPYTLDTENRPPQPALHRRLSRCLLRRREPGDPTRSTASATPGAVRYPDKSQAARSSRARSLRAMLVGPQTDFLIDSAGRRDESAKAVVETWEIA